ncbi:malate/citrate symporter [Candidatus Phytoplasma luffae]|uniref:Malate/citrate symporter n=1 Tax=Loofah witches'-broom phytoplasma TaxID=35773 RepID=A0A975FIL6_LOWBP|nr:2-hydroxycarboxylate transporter family protein [Candidatus Phytoplasma luffae]QTX03165.1 malate/citrate symporter [Candidatus Phytoplasma luffae]
MFKIKKDYYIFGIHPLLFLGLLLIGSAHIVLINYHPGDIKKLWHPILTPLFLMMILGFGLNFIGQSVPYLNKLGLGFLLCILVPSYLVHRGIINKTVADNFKKSFFAKPDTNDTSLGLGVNFSQFFITLVIAGSILSVDRNLLRRSLSRFIPLTLITVTSAILLTGTIGWALGYKCHKSLQYKSKGSFLDSIFFVCFPLTNGGTNLGINGWAYGKMGTIFQKIPSDTIRSIIIAPLVFARSLSIFLAGILFVIFNKTKFSGKGLLEKNQIKNSQLSKNKIQLNYKNIGIGMILIMGLYSVGEMINFGMTKINKNLKLDAMVYVILFLVLIKIFNLISDENQNYMSQTGKYISTNFTIPVLAGLGLTTKFSVLKEVAMDYKVVIMVLTSLLSTVIITFLLAKYFKFNAFEASLTAGISSHSIGGTGNIGVMEITKRSDLLPFAMISTRVVGPIIYTVSSILIGFVYN